jgi:hypothetical protein
MLKKNRRTRIMCERRVQGSEEVGILADFCLHDTKSGVFQNAV